MPVPPTAFRKSWAALPVLTSDEYNMYELVSILRSVSHDGFVEISRDCDVNAGAGAVGGNHDG